MEKLGTELRKMREESETRINNFIHEELKRLEEKCGVPASDFEVETVTHTQRSLQGFCREELASVKISIHIKI